MGRIYTVGFSGTVTAAGGDTDLCEILPAAQKPIKLRGFIVGQTSEVGDAQEEGVRISIVRLPATVTSGNGTGTTPQPMDSADTAAGATCETNGTTVATTSSTAVNLYEYGWNIRGAPLEVWYPDAAYCPKAKNAEGLVVRMQTTLADDATFAFTAVIEEE